MKIFVSWSGDLSKKMANTIRKYLPCMMHELDVFMSQHDLQSGVRWSTELSKQLETSSFGIICLTPANLESPWLLFEAGALTKHADGRACCLLIGELNPAQVSGPLAQFQNRPFGRDEIWLLLRDLNSMLTARMQDEQLQRVFNKWWPDLEQEHQQALVSAQNTPQRPRRDERDVLDDILLRLRSIERSLEMGPGSSMPAVSTLRRPALRNRLEDAWDSLEESQRNLLLELVSLRSQGREADQADVLKAHSFSDVVSLVKAGLLRDLPTGEISVHDVIIEFVREKAKHELSAPNLRPQADT
jgi:TIR domain